MKFYIIGIDDNQRQELTSKVKSIISQNIIFSGGKRHREIMTDLLPEAGQWIKVTVPLAKVFEQYKLHETLVVFASGDPLFFGLANTIIREFPEAEVEVYPSFNSLQLLAHRLKLPYQDMHIVTLTGRPWDKFDEALITGYPLLGVLTDRKTHTPSTIAKRMLDYGYDNYEMVVGELLGNEEREKVSTWPIAEVVGKEFRYPNNIILQQKQTRPRPFGLPNSEFHLLNNRANMITKMPIRLLSLSLLDLRSKAVFWDVGFCTGSVSIEAKLQFPHLKVIAFEQRLEGEELIEKNSQKWGTPGIDYYIGDFTQQDLTDIPAPEAIFIGGHGGKLIEILELVKQRMAPNACIVFNSVSLDSQNLFKQAIKNIGLQITEEVSIQVDEYNPILVMKATNK